MAGFTIKNAETGELMWKPGELGTSDLEKTARFVEILRPLLEGLSFTMGMDSLANMNLYDRDQIDAKFAALVGQEEIIGLVESRVNSMLSQFEGRMVELIQADANLVMQIEGLRSAILGLSEGLGLITLLEDAGMGNTAVDAIGWLKQQLEQLRSRVSVLEQA